MKKAVMVLVFLMVLPVVTSSQDSRSAQERVMQSVRQAEVERMVRRVYAHADEAYVVRLLNEETVDTQLQAIVDEVYGLSYGVGSEEE